MIEFNKLEFITPGAIQLEIEVNSLPYYTSTYIGRIMIDTEKTYTGGASPSDSPEYVLDLTDRHLTSLNTVIDVSSIINKGANILFVYAESAGYPLSNTPCGLDEQFSMKAVADLSAIYNEAFRIMNCNYKPKCRGCGLNEPFADLALKYFNFKTLMDNGDYDEALEFYKMLLGEGPSTPSSGSSRKKCNCHGNG